eukprot:TRINITY_DN675_c0_g1_i10.p3 TRINITY_DN675_c0_g1~~TRINITY_DN675_c0_g1_i10.p3  ORF type:complete len:353 (-),score=76.26 TRINITY_DN675_c0_g1_i10:6119-7177(-)
MRKQARKMKTAGVVPSITLQSPLLLGAKKEVGIPNSYPFKEQALEEELREKEQEKLERQQRRKKKVAEEEMMEPDGDYEGLEEVKVGSIIKAKEQNTKKPKEEPPKKKSRKEYVEELQSVLDESDVILVILDGRVPSECRPKDLEAKCAEKGKKVVLVLNKSDLIPESVLENWYERLSKELPTGIFNAMLESEEQCLELFKKVEKACKKTTTPIKVGVVGYPNVGKRSVLKALKTAVPKKFQLIEKTGTALGKKEPNSLIIKMVAELADLGDPYVPVHALIKKVPKDDMLLHYEIPDYTNTQEFLAYVARKEGFLLKGGLPDYDAAARKVLNDWVQGKIRYYQEPEQSDYLL